MNPLFDDICPPIEGELIPLHERAYVVRAYRRSPDALVLRGAVRDQKPPGLYIADDPDVITVHHMIVDLTIVIPSMEITEANVVIEVHPDPACPTITARYDQLVGLSIARGFTHRIRELFGGPRGCSHTTASGRGGASTDGRPQPEHLSHLGRGWRARCRRPVGHRLVHPHPVRPPAGSAGA